MNVVETLLFVLRSSMDLRKSIIAWLPVGWHASKSVNADDKGLHDLFQSLHECLCLPVLVPAVGVEKGHRHRCGQIRWRDFQQQAFVRLCMTALERASVSDNTGGAVTALQGSSSR